MRSYEKKLSNDTVLCGGLIAVGIAWAVFAAAHDFGAGASPGPRAAYVNAVPGALPGGDAAVRAATLPASARRGADEKASRAS